MNSFRIFYLIDLMYCNTITLKNASTFDGFVIKDPVNPYNDIPPLIYDPTIKRYGGN